MIPGSGRLKIFSASSWSLRTYCKRRPGQRCAVAYDGSSSIAFRYIFSAPS